VLRIDRFKQLRPEHRLLILWSGASIYLALIVALVFDLLHFSLAKELTEISIGVFGAVFAILAMRDAHRAFQKAQEVGEAVGSFRTSFRNVMEEMLGLAKRAKNSLCILIPTPAYGYLFGEPALSRSMVGVIEDFVTQEGTHLELYFVLGGASLPQRLLLPQRYLKRAYDLQKDRSSGVADEYVRLVERVFAVIKMNPGKVSLRVLNSDPNVRIIIADENDPEHRACLLSFAQSEPGDLTREFQSTGFRSTRNEMVQAVRDLVNVYAQEQSREAASDDVRSSFVILK
jgi:hypothetical protein